MTTDLQALAQGGRTNVTGFFIRLVARIPFLFIGAQWFGAEALGRLAYAILVVEFAAQLATLGLKKGLALHMAGAGEKNGAWDAVLVVLGATLIPTIVLMLVPEIMFPNSRVNQLDYLLPLTIPAMALSDVMIAALAFHGRVREGVRARAVIEPWTISIAAFALAWPLPRDGLLVAYALSMAAALLATLIPFLMHVGLPRAWQPKGRGLYTLARHNAPLAGAEAIEWGSRHIDLAILGLFVSPATVGIYWTCQHIATLPQKLKTSFDPVLGPALARSIGSGDKSAIARQVGQVGFWVLSAQLAVALALGLNGAALLGLIGPGREFVGGAGALALLLAAEVAASMAVTSEAALVYLARYRNFMLSGLMVGIQVVLTLALLVLAQEHGLPELWQAAAPALALMIALAIASFFKVRLISGLMRARLGILRLALLGATGAGVTAGLLTGLLPDWWNLALGIPAVLAAFGSVIWRWGFGADDRLLFSKVTV